MLLTTGAQIKIRRSLCVCVLVNPFEGKRDPFKVSVFAGFAYHSEYFAMIPASIPYARGGVLYIKFNINNRKFAYTFTAATSSQLKSVRLGAIIWCAHHHSSVPNFYYTSLVRTLARTPTHCERVAIDTPRPAFGVLHTRAAVRSEKNARLSFVTRARALAFGRAHRHILYIFPSIMCRRYFY